MISQMSYMMTLANSIIGVSVLAMPFCFKQCGIVLAAVVLLVSSILSRLACHFLVKSAVMSRRRNFELLAFHAFGHMGKFLVELFIIGFLVGTCIAFFVVVGDLGPQIVGKLVDKSPEDIRTSLLITTSVFIVLPLGLLRNIDSLSSICTATIAFYLCLVLKIMAESMQHIFAGDWYEHVYYWRPSGILQCLPIFSMALFCQTQLFEIYESIPNASLEKMNEVVRGALNICTIVYLCVGFFGYIAFCTQPFTGNILMSFETSLSSEMIKMGFVFSVAFSFPLVIFPCRASLNSLLFRRVYTHEPSMNYLPEARFRCLTIAIVTVSLITGILIPNIEFVLGLVGSTIGVMICLIFPAVFFISISSKHTNERLLAQAILFIGICIMVLGTYANLYAMEESTNTKAFATTNKPLSQMNNLPLNKEDINILVNVPNNPEILPNIKEKIDQLADVNIDKTLEKQIKDVRQEPPIPVERVIVTEKPVVITQKSLENLVATFAPEINEIVEKIKTLNENSNKDTKPMAKDDTLKELESVTLKAEEKVNMVEQKEKAVDMQKNENTINSDALKKEDSELLAADLDAANMMAAERHEKLWKTLEKHKLEQLQMMREQKKILKDIKEHKEEIEREKKKMAQDTEELGKNEKQPILQKEEPIPKESVYYVPDAVVNNEQSLRNELNAKISKIVKEQLMELTEHKVSKTQDLNGEKKSETEPEFTEVNHKQDIQKNFENKAISNKDAKVVDIGNNILINEQSKENSKIKGDNSQELLKGPIINALTKRALQKSVVPDEAIKNSDNPKLADEKVNIDRNEIPNPPGKADTRIEDKRIQDQFLLPIALKMRNQTKIDNTFEKLINKTEEDVQMIGRDILENHDREKRQADVEAEETNTKAVSDDTYGRSKLLPTNSIVENNQNECSKPEQSIGKQEADKSSKTSEMSVPKIYSTEVSLIKTNVYLADQEVVNPVSVNPIIPVRGEFVKVKQRDLKAVDSN